MKKSIFLLLLLVAITVGYFLGKAHTFSRLCDNHEVAGMVEYKSAEILERIAALNKLKLDYRSQTELEYICLHTIAAANRAETYRKYLETSGNNSIHVPFPGANSPDKDFHLLQSDLPLIDTGLWSDMVICDNISFFAVTLPDGTIAYTRCGEFRINDEGELLAFEQYPLCPPITGIPVGAHYPTVSEAGMVCYTDPSSGDVINVGEIVLYAFLNPQGLKPYSSTLFLETDKSGSATQGMPDTAGFGRILGGYTRGEGLEFNSDLSMLMKFSDRINVIAEKNSATWQRIIQYLSALLHL